MESPDVLEHRFIVAQPTLKSRVVSSNELVHRFENYNFVRQVVVREFTHNSKDDKAIVLPSQNSFSLFLIPVKGAKEIKR